MGEKMACELMKGLCRKCYFTNLQHSEIKSALKEKSLFSCRPWSLHSRYPMVDDKMIWLWHGNLWYLLIFCCDWQMKDSVWTMNCSLLMRPLVQWKLLLGYWQDHIFKRTHSSCWTTSCSYSLQPFFSTQLYYFSIINQYNLLLRFHEHFS